MVLWGSFVKFSHTVFALPFALASMMVAARETRGWPGWRVFGLILAAMVGARTCAMAFNRIVDRKFDAENPTAIEPLIENKSDVVFRVLIDNQLGGICGTEHSFIHDGAK